MPGPAYRVETERLLLRCWDPADASAFEAAVQASFDHLKSTIPWMAKEPLTFEQRVDKLRFWRAQFDRDEDYVYGAFAKDDGRLVGGVSLHTRAGPGALEIGYWMDVREVRKGFASEMSAALTRVAFEVHRVSRVEINCEPTNEPSVAVARTLGYTHEGTLKRRFAAVGGPGFRDKMCWSMFAEDFPRSSAATYRVEAFDALGARVLP